MGLMLCLMIGRGRAFDCRTPNARPARSQHWHQHEKAMTRDSFRLKTLLSIYVLLQLVTSKALTARENVLNSYVVVFLL